MRPFYNKKTAGNVECCCGYTGAVSYFVVSVVTCPVCIVTQSYTSPQTSDKISVVWVTKGHGTIYFKL